MGNDLFDNCAAHCTTFNKTNAQLLACHCIALVAHPVTIFKLPSNIIISISNGTYPQHLRQKQACHLMLSSTKVPQDLKAAEHQNVQQNQCSQVRRLMGSRAQHQLYSHFIAS